MKKKIFSALLALCMLSQTVALAATNLKTYVASDDTLNDYLDTNGMFDYGAYRNSPIVGTPAPSAVPTNITTTVRVDGPGAFASYTSAPAALDSGASTADKFDYKAVLDMSEVRTAFLDLYNNFNNWIEFDGNLTGDIDDPATPKGALWTQFLASEVTGQFEIELNFDSNLDINPSETFTLVQSSDTFVENVGARVLSDNYAKFVYNVKSGLTVQMLKNQRDARLADLSMTIENVTAAAQDVALGVDVEMTNAYIEVADNTVDTTYTLGDWEKFAKVYFASPAGDNSAAYVKVPSAATPTPTPTPTPGPVGPTGGGGGGVSAPKAYKVIDGAEYPVDVEKKLSSYYVNIDKIEDPVKEGYKFDGWYLDKGYTNSVTGEVKIVRTTYIYAKFSPLTEEAPKAYTVVDDIIEDVQVDEETGKYAVNVDAIEIPVKSGFAFDGWYLDPYYLTPATGIIEITEDTYLYAKLVSTSVPSGLISDHHIAYIYGYPDGEVKPNGLITREEVAAAFYRLLEPSYRATIETTVHQFPDVEADRWSNEEIATLANGGYIVGDQNGNFNPGAPITRAEFVTIANKFEQLETIPAINYFSDITGHWAEEAILSATNGHHWITGYEDGTFRPDNKITRAEAMTIINHMLVRYCDISSEIAKKWPDLAESDWYYQAVTEATTGHDFERDPDGWHEHWMKPAESTEE